MRPEQRARQRAERLDPQPQQLAAEPPAASAEEQQQPAKEPQP